MTVYITSISWSIQNTFLVHLKYVHFKLYSLCSPVYLWLCVDVKCLPSASPISSLGSHNHIPHYPTSNIVDFAYQED